MVSYSTPGGGVGPHFDSYHVFLIQGMGKRSWKIGREKIRKEKYIEGLDLKILSEEFIGDEFEVEAGDVIYIPPLFPIRVKQLLKV
jgi:50S ribosomal protein L16 3-hydroxylase